MIQKIMWLRINPLLLRCKRHRKKINAARFRGVNLGCGIDNPPQWLGIDGGITHLLVRRMPRVLARILFSHMAMSKKMSFADYRRKVKQGVYLHHDFMYGIPVQSGTAVNVFSSHFLEHLYPRQAEQFLSECKRILKPGGLIRICVPSLDDDVDKIRDALESYDSGDYEAILPYVTTERNGEFVTPYSHHRYMYNFSMLRHTLGTVGFECIAEKNAGQGEMEDVTELDSREGLYVEARKPGN